MSLYLGSEKVENVTARVTLPVDPSDDLPLADGTASAGVSKKFSRADHVHPKQEIPVKSVNNKTGAVTLSASDVGAQPTITVNGIIKGDGAGNLSVAELNPSSVGLGNVDNVKQYSASNPPPYPVTSVNGKTGAVSVNVPSASSTTPKAPGTASAGTSAPG